MMNMKSAFGLLATAALVLAPVAAFAGQSQVNSQGSKNSGVASGVGNTVVQDQDLNNIQNQADVDPNSYLNGTDPQLQINKQDGQNSGAAVGAGNLMIQDQDLNNLQNQVDVGR